MGCYWNKKNIIYSIEKPEILFIEICKKCNLECIHCMNRSGPKENEVIEYGRLCEIAEWFKTKKINRVVLSGGELFCLENAIDIIALFSEYSKVQILTNGTLLKEQYMKYLITNNILIQITLNGHKEDIDAQLRKNAFKRTCKNIIDLMRYDKAQDLVTISCTLFSGNINYIREMTVFCYEKLKVKKLQFSFIGCRGRAIDAWEDLKLSVNQKYKALNTILALKKKYKSYMEISVSGLHEFLAEVNEESISCEMLNREAEIVYPGEMRICPRLEQYLEYNRCFSKTIDFKTKETILYLDKNVEKKLNDKLRNIECCIQRKKE